MPMHRHDLSMLDKSHPMANQQNVGFAAKVSSKSGHKVFSDEIADCGNLRPRCKTIFAMQISSSGCDPYPADSAWQ